MSAQFRARVTERRGKKRVWVLATFTNIPLDELLYTYVYFLSRGVSLSLSLFLSSTNETFSDITLRETRVIICLLVAGLHQYFF